MAQAPSAVIPAPSMPVTTGKVVGLRKCPPDAVARFTELFGDPDADYQAALDRHESRGGHYRSDYPQTDGAAVHTRVRMPYPAALEAAE